MTTPSRRATPAEIAADARATERALAGLDLYERVVTAWLARWEAPVAQGEAGPLKGSPVPVRLRPGAPDELIPAAEVTP
jgi:hypothetical protein